MIMYLYSSMTCSLYMSTVKSSLYVGANVRGFRGLPLPANLHPRTLNKVMNRLEV